MHWENTLSFPLSKLVLANSRLVFPFVSLLPYAKQSMEVIAVILQFSIAFLSFGIRWRESVFAFTFFSRVGSKSELHSEIAHLQ